MKIYTKIVLDSENKVIEEEYFNYSGSLALAGIHYDFKSLSGVRAMKKKAKREKKLAERKMKRDQRKDKDKESPKKVETEKELDPNRALSLDFITNPNKK